MDKSARVESVLKKLTLQEKAALCSGADNWHLKSFARHDIPPVMAADGPHGLRKEKSSGEQNLAESYPATCFPTGVGLAASWNTGLLFEVGRALGEECQEAGVAVLLGPAMNIKRSPLCGRNFEYYSEDPYLSGELAAALIEGLQSVGVGACVKHFAANNQEKNRLTIDAVIDERALHEIYLAGFERAIRKGKPWTVMAAYNKVNGIYATEHRELLTGILRDKWGFDGVVMSDWGAVNDRVRALMAGLDLEMPASGGLNDRLLVEAVENGTLPEEVLNDTARRLLTLIFKAAEHKKQGFVFDRAAHHRLARKAAAESMVLLKNKNGLLPLAKDMRIALIGEFAKKPRYQGAGSSLVNPLQLENAYDAAVKLLANLTYSPGYRVDSDAVSEQLLADAVEKAKKADAVVIMAGLTAEYESEGYDRTHLQLPRSHNRLISEIAKVNDNVAVVLYNGAPVLMPWLAEVAAVVEAYLPGEAGGAAVWDVLLGEVNPSGRLPESFPASGEDYAAARYFPMGPERVEYRESIYVGYRYYDTAGVEPLFPFGHGLSYTSFAYTGLEVDKDEIVAGEKVNVKVTVKNTGWLPGMEVVQLYVREPEPAVFRPEKELQGFAKINLEPGEEKTVNFVLDKRSFAYYDVRLGNWRVKSGNFLLLVGASSRDIRLQKQIYVQSDLPETGFQKEPAVYYKPQANWEITREDFERLLGRKLSKAAPHRRYHRNSTLAEARRNLIGRLLYRQVKKEIIKRTGGNKDQLRMMQAVALDMPLRGLAMMSGGRLDFETLDALICFMNGSY